MDDNKRKEIEEKVKNCKLKIANEQAKLGRYETQLAVGKSGHTKQKVKSGQKPTKTTPKPDQNPNPEKKKDGFFDVIFS